MGDVSVLATSYGVASIDEWHDASAENSLCSSTNVTMLNDNEHESSSHEDILIKSKQRQLHNKTLPKCSMQFSGETSVNINLNLGPAAISEDTQAQKERDNCDYSIKITLDMAKNGAAPRKIRIYADGKRQMKIFLTLIVICNYTNFRHL